jgi:hypothetical protein
VIEKNIFRTVKRQLDHSDRRQSLSARLAKHRFAGSGGGELDDAWDFKRFSMLVELPAADLVPVQAAFDGLASLPGLQTAWVVEARLRKLADE